jgi:hypothetical protein
MGATELEALDEPCDVIGHLVTVLRNVSEFRTLSVAPQVKGDDPMVTRERVRERNGATIGNGPEIDGARVSVDQEHGIAPPGVSVVKADAINLDELVRCVGQPLRRRWHWDAGLAGARGNDRHAQRRANQLGGVHMSSRMQAREDLRRFNDRTPLR